MDKIVSLLLSILGIAVLVLFLIAGVLLVYKMLFGKGKIKENVNEEKEEPTPEKVVYPYKLTNCIFSDKEKYFYRDVRPIADKLGLLIFAKMRIADLLYIPEGTKDYMKWFNYIKAKHIDFIFVDKELRVKILVEIDDPSHNRPYRKERDEKVDEMFRQQGLQVLHLRKWGKKYEAEELETIITNALNIHVTS